VEALGKKLFEASLNTQIYQEEFFSVTQMSNTQDQEQTGRPNFFAEARCGALFLFVYLDAAQRR